MRPRHLARSKTVILVLAAVLLAGCTAPKPVTPGPSLPVQAVEKVGDWLEIYFTDPDAPRASSFEDGPDEALAASIDAARLSVDVAIYSLNLWSIRNALLRAHARGVTVRMVMESDNMDANEVQDLIAAGIPVRGDQQEGLMHDKFVIIDRYEVWASAMNFTVNGAYEDNNNLLHIRSGEIAENYLVEFNEMFEQGQFGPYVIANTPNPLVVIEGTVVEVYFSPDDGVQARLVELLNAAQQSIHFLAFSFTADSLGNAIRNRAAAGVTVAGVMEAEQVTSNTGTEYDPFLQAGLNVLLDANDDLMHHKVLIIDESIVVTGSYNFSASAETRNDENVIIIYNRDVASAFLSEFWRVYNRALP